MEGIELDIFHHTNATKQKDEQGLDWLMAECDIRSMTFYRIDVISKYMDDDDSEYSNIYVGGEVWNCLLTYEDLKEKLREWKTSNAIQS